WHLVEGPKDAAALQGLGLLACGLNTCRLNPRFARLFAQTEIIIIPDRDRAGEEGGLSSARALRGVAKSVRIAILPSEFKESQGDDVRDVLCRQGGHDLVLRAIADAQEWEPEPDVGELNDSRPEILVTPDEHEVNDQAIKALCGDLSLFQRGGIIVQI